MRTISWLAGAMALAVMLLGACSGPTDNQPANEARNHAQTELTLDGDKKWQADQHTRTSMKGISEALANTPTGSVDEMRALGADLNVQLKDLVAGCTMTGESHNQLHVFLEDFMPAAESLAQQQDEAKARETVAELNHMVKLYHDHFE